MVQAFTKEEEAMLSRLGLFSKVMETLRNESSTAAIQNGWPRDIADDIGLLAVFRFTVQAALEHPEWTHSWAHLIDTMEGEALISPDRRRAAMQELVEMLPVSATTSTTN
jgi:hypothetical protein